MTQETKGSPRTGLILAAAATALTVAAGLTAGALLGYVGPARTSAASAPVIETAPTPVAARATSLEANASFADGSQGNVGVEPAPAEMPPVELGQEAPRQEPGAAREEEHERGERRHHGRREHERREHERGGDDDD